MNGEEKQNTLAKPIDQRPNGYLAQHMDSHYYYYYSFSIHFY